MSPRILEDFYGVEDDGEGSREHDEVKVYCDEEEGSPDIRSGEVPEGLRHGQTMTLLLLGFLYLTDLLTDILRSSSDANITRGGG